ncbi:unnamed protein product, partial [Meganyctiphanes norvegica]
MVIITNSEGSQLTCIAKIVLMYRSIAKIPRAVTPPRSLHHQQTRATQCNWSYVITSDLQPSKGYTCIVYNTMSSAVFVEMSHRQGTTKYRRSLAAKISLTQIKMLISIVSKHKLTEFKSHCKCYQGLGRTRPVRARCQNIFRRRAAREQERHTAGQGKSGPSSSQQRIEVCEEEDERQKNMRTHKYASWDYETIKQGAPKITDLQAKPSFGQICLYLLTSIRQLEEERNSNMQQDIANCSDQETEIHNIKKNENNDHKSLIKRINEDNNDFFGFEPGIENVQIIPSFNVIEDTSTETDYLLQTKENLVQRSLKVVLNDIRKSHNVTNMKCKNIERFETGENIMVANCNKESQSSNVFSSTTQMVDSLKSQQ